jgi:hypothetical protein
MREDRSFVEHNNAARARLQALVERLSDEQLARPMNGDLTVAGILAHLAFWDGRSLYLLEKWEKGGPGPRPADCEPEDVDWINDAARPLFTLIPPRQAARLAVALAESVDRKVAALSDEQMARNRAAGGPLNLLRAEHRLEHVEELEREFGLS